MDGLMSGRCCKGCCDHEDVTKNLIFEAQTSMVAFLQLQADLTVDPSARRTRTAEKLQAPPLPSFLASLPKLASAKKSKHLQPCCLGWFSQNHCDVRDGAWGPNSFMSFLAALLNGWPPSKHRFEGSCNLVCKLPLWMQISFPLPDLGNSLSLMLREKQYWSQNGFNNMSPQKLWGVMAQRGPAPIIDPIPGTPNRSHTGHTKIFLSMNESAWLGCAGSLSPCYLSFREGAGPKCSPRSSRMPRGAIPRAYGLSRRWEPKQ